MYTFEDWYKTAWDKINVDTLIEETKKLAKEVKTLNKAVSCCCGLVLALALMLCLGMTSEHVDV